MEATSSEERGARTSLVSWASSEDAEEYGTVVGWVLMLQGNKDSVRNWARGHWC